MTDLAFVPLQREAFDPVAELGRMRAEQPVTKLEFPFGISAWLVTRYDDVRTVLMNATDFSNDFANLTKATGGLADEDKDPGGLGFADPPKHTRLRRLLTPEFTVRRLQRLIPRIEAVIDEQLDAMEQARAAAPDAPVDLVGQFAVAVPSLVISELLDVPVADREAFTRLSAGRFDLFGGMFDSLDAMSESLVFMSELVSQQRAHPGDGLLGAIIREHGDAITDRELAGLADGVLVGGHETTASMLAMGAVLLLQSPEAAAVMRSGDADAVQQLVEELLRYLTVVQVAFPRFARTDVQVGGVTIPAGSMVLCSLSGADRDPALPAAGRPTEAAASGCPAHRGRSLEEFNPHRAATAHLAFGHGIHRCVGAELARIELRIAYPRLLRRFPELRLAVPPRDLTFRELSIVHGLDRVPVTW
ncbi:cytochrome P450 [Nakamurella leprariae]|uniref:Cytochrome P450 n=1 Tax=Nakamurella leprariae TaxID=2803911 RepID=A0A938YGE4_9ACTN|nr:cytochrome P450 [Nakamurella leprariae]MBM9469041.1 cytochrome P450 [Nakamurella leprariae]